MKNTTLLLFFLVFSNHFLFAQTNITVGEEASKINISQWLKNQPEDDKLKGKFIVLEFWASWCKPCLNAVPHLNELQAQFDRPNLLFLSMTYEPEKIAKDVFARGVNFETPVVTDLTKETQKQFGDGIKDLNFYPLTVLIDDRNIIRWFGNPEELTVELMEDFLKGKALNSTDSEDLEFVVLPETITRKAFFTLFDEEQPKRLFYMQALEGSAEMPIGKGIYVYGGGAYYQHVGLRELFHAIVPETKLIFPDTLKSQSYDFAYFDKLPDGKMYDRLVEQIAEAINLNVETSNQPITQYQLKIKNDDRLKDTKNRRFDYARDGNQLQFENISLKLLATKLTQLSDVVFVFSEKDKRTINLTVDANSAESLLASLKENGFAITKRKKKMKVVELK
ncbi:MAG: TlpA disulfide reductase family protein [Bacteroidota bacterium]